MKLFELLFGKKEKGTVSINGHHFVGNNVSIINDVVYVDGVKQTTYSLKAGPVTVNVVGDVESVSSTSGKINVSGNAGSVQATSGDVHCGVVSGNVGTTSGNIRCTGIFGKASTVSGDISGGR